ncbi:MAG: hypothetical protein JO309_07815 [Pseudonocardiales bacterium]|nr:hypothetical protein [Pseudonocardiales bacterium]MBV9729294.1 hypothetical protein [Pseudonocardiales bacterium]
MALDVTGWVRERCGEGGFGGGAGRGAGRGASGPAVFGDPVGGQGALAGPEPGRPWRVATRACAALVAAASVTREVQ